MTPLVFLPALCEDAKPASKPCHGCEAAEDRGFACPAKPRGFGCAVLGSHFGVFGAPTHFRTYFSGWIESDVHWGYDLDFDPWPFGFPTCGSGFLSVSRPKQDPFWSEHPKPTTREDHGLPVRGRGVPRGGL